MKRLFYIVLSLLVLIGCKTTKPVVQAPAPTPIPMEQPRKADELVLPLDSIALVMDSAITAGAIPGGVVCLTADTGIIFLQAYGNRQLVPDTLPMTTHTIFDLASLTKSVATTTAMMTLVSDSAIDLNTPVQHFLPHFVGGDSISIVHLMTHTSGLPAYLNANRLANRLGEYNREALIDTICTCPRWIKPGTKRVYSCLNFITVQNIIEQVSHERFDLYCQKHVFEPLGMFHTTFFPLMQEEEFEMQDRYNPISLTAPVAPTEVLKDTDCPLHKAVHDPLARIMNAGISGNAGAFSNAEDLARLAQFLLVAQNDSLVQLFTTAPDSLAFANRTPGWALPDSTLTYLGTHPVEGTYGHTGYTGTSMVISPKQRKAVIILTNRVHPKDEGGVARLRRKITDWLLTND